LAEAAARFELRPLDWDTSFFGSKMGTIVPLSEATGDSARANAPDDEIELRTLAREASAAAYAHVIFRVLAEQTDTAQAAEAAGFRLVDVGIDSTFFFATTPLPQSTNDAPIREARPADLPGLQGVAASAFAFSRFAADPFFSAEQVAAFYREWTGNLFHGLAQSVLVVEVDRKPAGFVSCALTAGEGRIPLIATRADLRRRGLGRVLVTAALRWFADAGATVAHVKTQAANYPALALYHRLGFVISRAELTFSISFPHAPASA
jgi:ribosomal protein S18 acetylase RimI-like enzyme